jgi:PKD repeat protein
LKPSRRVCLPFFPIFLLITLTLSQSLQLVNASSSLILTVNTNKQVYYLGEKVEIYGTFKNDSLPVSDSLIAIEVDEPGAPLALRTITIGTPPTPTVSIRNVFLCDQTGGPKDTLYIPIPAPPLVDAYLYMTLDTSTPLNITAAFTIQDNKTVPVATVTHRTNITGSTSLKLFVPIPPSTSTGTATVYANVYTHLPKLDGHALGQEKNGTFQIVRGSGGTGTTNTLPLSENSSTPIAAASETNGTYEMNFRLSDDPENGTHTVYCSSKVGQTLVTNSKTFEVESTPYPPQASFTYTPPNPSINCSVTFDASASTPRGGYIVDYAWDFGDDEFGNGKVVTYAYNQSGTYVVTLNVTDSEGLWCTTSKPVLVSSIYGPTASFTYIPVEPFVNGTTTFDASSSTPGWNGTGNPPIVEYKWDFGDNTSTVVESDPVTTHIYQTNGTFTVTLNITDTMGWWDTTSQNVTVSIVPVQHDIGIINATYMPTVAYANMTPPINVTVVVRNNGTIAETFNVTAYHNITATEWASIETQTVTQLDPLAETTLCFTWNTSTLPLYVNYTLKIETSPILNDTNPADNTVIAGTLMVKMSGDVDGNRMVESTDLVFGLSPAMGSMPGDPNWNPNADFNGNGSVDSWDLIFGFAPFYGSSY